MKPIKIYFFETFPLPTGGWQKLGMEIELESADEPRTAFYHAKKTIETQFWESNKAAEKEKEQSIQEPRTSNAQLIADIYSCTTLKTLEAYKLIVRNKPDLKSAYDSTLLKLSK